MSLNLKRFLRRTSPDVLREYFDSRKSGLLVRVEWENPSQTGPDVLFGAISALPPREHDAIITDFEHVEMLCDPTGQRALHSVAATDVRILTLLKAAVSDEARAIELLIASDSLFEHALVAAYADRLRSGRSWSAFSIDGAATMGEDPPNITAFEAELAATLTRSDGSVGKLKMDSFNRGTVSEDGKVTGLAVHHAIYREDLPISDIEFRGEELKREIRHPVQEGAILYNVDGGSIDVIASGWKAIRARIANSFAQNMLCVKGKLHAVAARHYSLDRLKQPLAFETDPADGIRMVKVTLLQLGRMGAAYERITIQVDPSERMDICARSAQWFRDSDPLRWPGWWVTHATLRIVFHPEAGKTRERVVTIELRAPNGSNLRDQTRRHQIISQKYLERWGLIAAPRA